MPPAPLSGPTRYVKHIPGRQELVQEWDPDDPFKLGHQYDQVSENMRLDERRESIVHDDDFDDDDGDDGDTDSEPAGAHPAAKAQEYESIADIPPEIWKELNRRIRRRSVPRPPYATLLPGHEIESPGQNGTRRPQYAGLLPGHQVHVEPEPEAKVRAYDDTGQVTMTTGLV